MNHSTVSIIQPSFLPWRGYFQIISQSDAFVFYDNVQYDKRGWRNRNQIKTSTGLQWITVPVQTKGKYLQLINETEIDYSAPWAKKMLNAIRTAYGKAPYFDLHFPWLSEALDHRWQTISDLDIHLTKKVASLLEIQTPFYLSSDLNLKETDPASRLVEVCQLFSAKKYISGPSARDYIGEGEVFKNANIHLEYAEYLLPTYSQLFGEFAPYASIIDLLFNEGPNSKNFI